MKKEIVLLLLCLILSLCKHHAQNVSVQIDWRFIGDVVHNPMNVIKEAMTGQVGGIWSKTIGD